MITADVSACAAEPEEGITRLSGGHSIVGGATCINMERAYQNVAFKVRYHRQGRCLRQIEEATNARGNPPVSLPLTTRWHLRRRRSVVLFFRIRVVDLNNIMHLSCDCCACRTALRTCLTGCGGWCDNGTGLPQQCGRRLRTQSSARGYLRLRVGVCRLRLRLLLRRRRFQLRLDLLHRVVLGGRRARCLGPEYLCDRAHRRPLRREIRRQ